MIELTLHNLSMHTCCIKFEDLLGVKLVMSPINECLIERCESGGCSNILVSTGHPILINTNSTSYVGVMTYVQVDCICAAKTFTDNNQDVECQPATCLNGGTCHQRDYGFTLVKFFPRLEKGVDGVGPMLM